MAFAPVAGMVLVGVAAEFKSHLNPFLILALLNLRTAVGLWEMSVGAAGTGTVSPTCCRLQLRHRSGDTRVFDRDALVCPTEKRSVFNDGRSEIDVHSKRKKKSLHNVTRVHISAPLASLPSSTRTTATDWLALLNVTRLCWATFYEQNLRV